MTVKEQIEQIEDIDFIVAYNEEDKIYDVDIRNDGSASLYCFEDNETIDVDLNDYEANEIVGDDKSHVEIRLTDTIIIDCIKAAAE